MNKTRTHYLLGLLLWYSLLTACTHTPTGIAATEIPSSDPLLGLFENSSSSTAYTLIEQAQKSIDIEAYEMSDQKFRNMLIDALTRGVSIRILKDEKTVGDLCNEMERSSSLDTDECKAEKKFVRDLKKLGGRYQFFAKDELCGMTDKHCYQHGKLILVDGKKALISTGNFNSTSFCNDIASMKVEPERCNRDYTFVTSNASALKMLLSLFDLDWKGDAYDVTSITQGSGAKNIVTVGPIATEPLTQLIQSAEKEILMQTQYLHQMDFNDQLITMAKKGVEVKVMVSDLCYFSHSGNETYAKDKSIFEALIKAGIQVRFWSENMQIKNHQGYLHAKAITVDNKISWIGSTNNSDMSFFKNREFGLIFQGSTDVNKLTSIMKNDFSDANAMTWKQLVKHCHIP